MSDNPLKLSKESLRIVTERPDLWEYRLFGQVIIDEIKVIVWLLPRVRDRVQQGGFAPRAPISSGELATQVIENLQELSELQSELGALVNANHEDAFGPPGKPGDVDAVVVLARKIGNYYRRAIEWAEIVRRTPVEQQRAELVRQVGDRASGITNGIQNFALNLLGQIERAKNDFAEEVSQTIRVSFVIEVPDDARLTQEIKRFEETVLSSSGEQRSDEGQTYIAALERTKSLFEERRRWLDAEAWFRGELLLSWSRYVAASAGRHLATLLRKRRNLLVHGDYGEVDSAPWLRELNYFLTHACRVPDYVMELTGDAIRGHLDSFLEGAASSAPPADEASVNLAEMSGPDYERLCADYMRACGFDATVTKASGDQGVDVVARKAGLTVAMQCKLYSSPVGNKAVQEIYAAKGFVEADLAVVVSNNEFTDSARQLAQVLGVRLLHHSEIKSHFSE